jgi:hypothetical protein
MTSAGDVRAGTRERWVRLFIAAQVAIPVVATIYHGLTGIETWWGWSMFSR